MKVIYVINGTAKAGKNTFVKFIKQYIEREYNISVYDLSSVDPTKEAAKILGWDGNKDEKGREFLHRIKMLSSEFYDGPFTWMIDQIKSDGIYFFHIREPQEIETFVKSTKAKTIFIDRQQDEQFSNEADKNVANYLYDFYVFNYSNIENFNDSAIKFANNIIEEIKHYPKYQFFQ